MRAKKSMPRAKKSTPREQTSTPRTKTSTPRTKTSMQRTKTSTPREQTSTPRTKTSMPRAKTSMQRIESGRFRGRKLLTLPTGVPGLRPTGARVRGAIFDRLQHEVIEARVLDLFAGSGALSLEALSRGATACTLLEIDPRVVGHLRQQLEVFGVSAQARVIKTDALRWLRVGRVDAAFADGPYDLVFIDPPFAMPDVIEPIAHALVDGDWLAPGAWLVCERELVRGTTGVIAWPKGLTLERSRDYGQARLELLRHHGDPTGSQP